MEPVTTALMLGNIGLSAANLFGSKSKKVKLPAQYYQSMDELLKLGTADVNQPLRQIAQLSPLEQAAENIVTQWLGQPTPETRQVAEEQALDIATTPVDVTRMPEYKGLLDKVIEEGNIMANRISRGLQLGGAATGEPARDILGRSVTGTQERLIGTLAPIIQAERDRQMNAINILNQLTEEAESTIGKKVGLAGGVGSLNRQIEQQFYDAILDQALRDIQFQYQIQPEILRSVMGGTVGTLQGGEPSTFAQASPLISSVLQAAILSGLGQGGGVQTMTPYNTYYGPQNYGYLGGYAGGF